jgi:hypothetical protein
MISSRCLRPYSQSWMHCSTRLLWSSIRPKMRSYVYHQLISPDVAKDQAIVECPFHLLFIYGRARSLQLMINLNDPKCCNLDVTFQIFDSNYKWTLIRMMLMLLSDHWDVSYYHIILWFILTYQFGFFGNGYWSNIVFMFSIGLPSCSLYV